MNNIELNPIEYFKSNTNLLMFITSHYIAQQSYKNKKIYKVTSENELSKIKILNSKNVKICPITNEKIGKIGKLKCGHEFEYEAIYKWLSSRSYTCPCCRYEFESTEQIEYYEDDKCNYYNEIIPHSYIIN